MQNEWRSAIEAPGQMGHGANLMLTTYGHVFDALAGERIDAEATVEAARTDDIAATPLASMRK